MIDNLSMAEYDREKRDFLKISNVNFIVIKIPNSEIEQILFINV